MFWGEKMARKIERRDISRSALRENESFRTMAEEKRNYARLKDYGLGADVELFWDLNHDAIQDRIFKISINGEVAYLDWEEFLHYARLI